MATRRGIGRGLQAAGAALGDYFQRQAQEDNIRRRQILDDERAAEQAKHNQEAMAERENIIQKATTNRTLESEHFKNNPVGLARRVNQPILPEDVAAPLSEEISKSKEPKDLMTLSDLMVRSKNRGMDTTSKIGEGNGLSPAIEALMHQRLAKQQQVEEEANIPTTKVTEMASDGSTTDKFLPTRKLSGQSFQTGLSAQQKGVNEGATAVAAAPGKGRAENTVENLTRSGKAATAGATARATAQAQADVKYSPQSVAGEIKLITQKAIAEAAAEGNKEAAQMAQKAAADATVASIALTQLKNAYDGIKLPNTIVGNTKALGRQAAGAAGMQQYWDPKAAELDKQADQYAMLLYRAFGGTGANVSDKDIQMMKGGIPYSYVLADIGDEVFRNSATLISYSAMIKKRYGTQPFEVQMQVGQTWLELAKKARELGATEFRDPNDPSKTVPVVK